MCTGEDVREGTAEDEEEDEDAGKPKADGAAGGAAKTVGEAAALTVGGLDVEAVPALLNVAERLENVGAGLPPLDDDPVEDDDDDGEYDGEANGAGGPEFSRGILLRVRFTVPPLPPLTPLLLIAPLGTPPRIPRAAPRPRVLVPSPPTEPPLPLEEVPDCGVDACAVDAPGGGCTENPDEPSIFRRASRR